MQARKNARVPVRQCARNPEIQACKCARGLGMQGCKCKNARMLNWGNGKVQERKKARMLLWSIVLAYKNEGTQVCENYKIELRKNANAKM